jgi:glucose-1-phosphate thymidylyltransferase
VLFANRYLCMIVKGLIVLASSATPGGGRGGAALQRVANRPIVCHVLEQLRQAGVVEVAAVVSAEHAPKLQACVDAEGPAGIAITCFEHQRDELFDGSLAAAVEFVGEAPCVVYRANGLLAQPLTPLVRTLRERSVDLLAVVSQANAGAGSMSLPARRLLRLAEVPADEHELDLAGVCLFGPGALRHAGAIGWWQGGTFDLVALAGRFDAAGRTLHVEHAPAWWCYSGGASELLAMNRFALDALRLDPVSVSSPSGNRIEGCVWIDPSANVQSSVIVGPAIVGAGASIADSYIGPYTSIGAEVRIEGAEVERSIILPGATITHIGGRLVGSVIGRQARVFRDFSLPRALRLNVGDGDEVALC